jgi:hypothetical protein
VIDSTARRRGGAPWIALVGATGRASREDLGLADVDDPAAPRNILGLHGEEFASPGPLRDRLLSAIIEGRKVFTTALALDYEIGRAFLP